MLLGIGRKNEVVVRLRDEHPLSLRTFGPSPTPDAAGAYSDQALLHLITRTLRVSLRINEAGEPLALIRLHVAKGHRREKPNNQQDHDGMLGAHATQQKTNH